MPRIVEARAGVYMADQVPVVLYKNGERVVIGTGYISENSIFVTHFNDNPDGQRLYKQLIDMEHFSLPVTISEVVVEEGTSDGHAAEGQGAGS